MKIQYFLNKIYYINLTSSFFLFNNFFNYKNFIIDIYLPFWIKILIKKL